MFLINFLDRNATSGNEITFYCIYGVEACFFIALLIVSYAVGMASWRSTFHLNIRLRILCIIIHSDISNAARFSVLVNQVFGPSNRGFVRNFVARENSITETTTHIIIASLIREAFLAYFTTLASIIALDRCAALFAWSWYESGVSTTLVFFVLQESILVVVAWIMSSLTVYDYITDMNLVQYCGGALLAGSLLFILIYRENLCERRILRQGATVGAYAMYSRIVGPLVIFCAPEFVFYPAYTLLPPGTQWNFWRHLSIALYDLWIGIISVVVLVCIPLVEPRIARNLPCIPQRLRQLFKKRNEEQSFSVIKRTSSAEASMYFNMLEKDLGRSSLDRY